MNNKIPAWAVALFLCACTGGDRDDDQLNVPPGEDVSADESADKRINSWIVDTDQNLSPLEIESAASEVIDGDLNTVTLFPDGSGLDGMYVIESTEALSEREALDVAYALKDLAVFSDAVPNFQVHEPDLPRAAAAACLSGSGAAPVPAEKGWSLDHMHVLEAWALVPEAGGKSQGEGVTICHPDSGWTVHTDLDAAAVDFANAKDFVDKGASGEDPLNYKGNPGHGTATGSVLISRGGIDDNNDTTQPGLVTGVAPKAQLIPIRAIKGVVRFLDSNTARAVNYARSQSCDVISMSLGGAGFFGLKKAIRKAVDEDVIVVSAAGNCVGFVVAPASYKTTIAAAASNSEMKPWKGSSRGKAVTMTAPGEAVYIARRGRGSTDTRLVEPSDGTSFAAAEIAAAAANWIAFHGKAKLDQAKGSYPLADLFRFVLQDAVDVPPGWDTRRYGPGILNLEKLLEANIDLFPKDQPRSMDRETALSTLAQMIDRTPSQTRALLQHLFGDGDPEQLADAYGAELQRLTVTKPQVMTEILNQVDRRLPRTAITEETTRSFSSRMRAATQTQP